MPFKRLKSHNGFLSVSAMAVPPSGGGSWLHKEQCPLGVFKPPQASSRAAGHPKLPVGTILDTIRRWNLCTAARKPVDTDCKWGHCFSSPSPLPLCPALAVRSRRFPPFYVFLLTSAIFSMWILLFILLLL